MRPNEQELAELHEGEIVVYERKNKLLELLAKGRRETENEVTRSLRNAGGQRGLHEIHAPQ